MQAEMYYRLLKEKFPSKEEVLTEIINLDAINHLPKGTEHYLSDLHGQYDAFDYLLRNGSGTIRRKVTESLAIPDYPEERLDLLCQLIYYPNQKMAQLKGQARDQEVDQTLLDLIPELLTVIKYFGSKYTRSKIRKMIPKSHTYIIEELIGESDQASKHSYIQAILHKIHSLGQLEELVEVLCHLIQDLVVDHLHVVGDIYDRGPEPDLIIDRLMDMRSVDIQWGNHDITWIGAMAGSLVCLMNVIRITARYGNLVLLEDRYGINLRPLIDYARSLYQPLSSFAPSLEEDQELSQAEQDLHNVVQQATAMLQFKLEHQLIRRRPDFQLDHRLVLDKIDYQDGKIRLGEATYPLKDFQAVTINPLEVSALTKEEQGILDQVLASYQRSDRLKKHLDFLVNQGSMYLIYNKELLFHGCIPLHSNGDFQSLKVEGHSYAGKALLDYYEEQIRAGYRNPQEGQDLATDLFWYLWVGENSSLFGKKAMTTFERYYIEEKATHKEVKNAYYQLREDPNTCIAILREFGLGPESHIVNGHTPILEKRGENPIKAGGKLLVIDGGMSKGYQRKTGIAGYTLVSNSYGLEMVAHRPFTSVEDVLAGGCEIFFTKRLVEQVDRRLRVADSQVGQGITREIQVLEDLYYHYDLY